MQFWCLYLLWVTTYMSCVQSGRLLMYPTFLYSYALEILFLLCWTSQAECTWKHPLFIAFVKHLMKYIAVTPVTAHWPYRWSGLGWLRCVRHRVDGMIRYSNFGIDSWGALYKITLDVCHWTSPTNEQRCRKWLGAVKQQPLGKPMFIQFHEATCCQQ